MKIAWISKIKLTAMILLAVIAVTGVTYGLTDTRVLTNEFIGTSGTDPPGGGGGGGTPPRANPPPAAGETPAPPPGETARPPDETENPSMPEDNETPVPEDTPKQENPGIPGIGPNTGDDANQGLWLMLLAVGLLVLRRVLFFGKKHKNY